MTAALQLTSPPLILASSSPARAAMLAAAGLLFIVQRPLVDETSILEALRSEGVKPGDAATTLAEFKATSVADRVPGDQLVIGADQILELDGQWLEKPIDKDAARTQLQALRGRQHRLHSAAVVLRNRVRVWHAVSTADLTVRAFGEAWLDTYLEVMGDDVLGSVGCYRVEGLGAQLLSEISGDHFTVQGLPLLPLVRFLRDHGVLLS